MIGRYQYEISITLTDPTVKLIDSMAERLITASRLMDSYYQELFNEENYDAEIHSTKPKFYMSQILNSSDSVTLDSAPVWILSNIAYVNAASFLYNLSIIDKNELNRTVSSKLDPRNATRFSVLSFIEDLNKTESLIKKNPQISNQIINNMILDKVENTNIQI